MVDCRFLEKCPIFAKFKSEGLKNFWIKMYCKGAKGDECARRKLKEIGKDVPLTLLPNGKTLESLGK